MWESATASDAEVSAKKVEYIAGLRSNDPAVGYNRWPKFQAGGQPHGHVAKWLPTSYGNRAAISVLPLLFVALFYVEALFTHRLLSELRAELLKGVSEWPAPLEKRSTAAGQ